MLQDPWPTCWRPKHAFWFYIFKTNTGIIIGSNQGWGGKSKAVMPGTTRRMKPTGASTKCSVGLGKLSLRGSDRLFGGELDHWMISPQCMPHPLAGEPMCSAKRENFRQCGHVIGLHLISDIVEDPTISTFRPGSVTLQAVKFTLRRNVFAPRRFTFSASMGRYQ